MTESDPQRTSAPLTGCKMPAIPANYYAASFREYAQDRCEIDLWDALYRLGYMPDEIQWHVDHPGERMITGYSA